MIILPTLLNGTYVIEPERLEDERGFFARTWCQREFQNYGLNLTIVQCSVSFNRRKGTLRGMHYQAAPKAEAKVVRCTRGAIYDVIVDIRPGSATFKKWVATELTAENHRMHYIPEGLAHGFQTLEDETEVFYEISEFHAPECARGFRWDDPVFDIDWPPASERIISDRDRNFPDFL